VGLDILEGTTCRLFSGYFFKLQAEIPIPSSAKPGETLELVCKATDRAYNTQPETAAGLWNIRGLLHTAWSRLNVLIE
jgi:sulfite oxidase